MAKVECNPWSRVTTPEMECGQVEVKHTTAVEIFNKIIGNRCAKVENKYTTAAEIVKQYFKINRTHMAAEMAHKYVEELVLQWLELHVLRNMR